MARHYYRCSKCRTRNTFPRAVDDYIRPRSCRACGYMTFYVDKERVARKPCRCDGGLLTNNGSVPHRPGSPCCELNPRHAINRAQRMGAPVEMVMDLSIDLAWDSDGGRVCDQDAPHFDTRKFLLIHLATAKLLPANSRPLEKEF